MAQSNMNNLTTLIKRLEAATSRLEDIASTSVAFDATDPEQAPGASLALIHSEAVTPKASESLPASIAAFDALLNTELKQWLDLSAKLGSVIDVQAQHVKDAFTAQRQFLLAATKAKKPDISTWMNTLDDLRKAMEDVEIVKDNNREATLRNPLTMVADGVGALGWVTLDESKGQKPHDQILELLGGAQLHGNKVLQEFKDKPDKINNVEWVKAYYKLFKAVAEYTKQHHTTGVAWNKNGIDAKEAVKQVKNASAAPASNIPPPPPLPPSGGVPPPPGPPPPGMPPAPKAKAPAADMGAVFDELNKGESVTKGLRKVDPSQMTHKNPSLRATAPVPTRSDSSGSLRSKSPAPPGKKPKPESMRTKKPPKKELDGNRWIIDNFDTPGEPVEIEAEAHQSILISRCKNTTIRVNGKANALSLDNSSRTSLVVDSLVSSVDVIKCPNFALQVMGTLPTLLLDQVDGASIYLSKDSLNTEVFTSKSSSININLPTADDDFKENAIPEQFRSYIQNGQLVHEIVEHAG